MTRDIRPRFGRRLGHNVFACGLLLASAALQASPNYSVFDLDRIAPEGLRPFFRGMNNSGQLVGILSPDGSPFNNQGVVFTLDTATSKDFAPVPMLLPYTTSPTIESPAPFAINDRGQIAGTISVYKAEGEQRSFYYSAAEGMRDLGYLDPNDPFTAASDINAAGQIVGMSMGVGPGDRSHAVIYDTSNGLTRLALPSDVSSSSARVVNDHGVVAGNFNRANDNDSDAYQARGFVFDGQHFTELGSLGGRVWLTGLNNSGAIAGTSYLQPGWGGNTHAVLYTEGGTQLLDLQATQQGNTFSSSWTVGLNEHNQVIGTATLTGTFQQSAFYYDEQLGLVDLNSLLDPTVAAGWRITDVQDINDWGQILARATALDGSEHAVLLSDLTAPVPDLSAGTSLLFGLALLGAKACSSRKHRPKTRAPERKHGGNHRPALAA